MGHLKYYFALQVILLFNLHLMLAEGEGLQDNPIKPHITPRILSGSGRIVGISKKIKVKNDGSKDMNNLLYAIYRKFHQDNQRQDSGNEDIQHKKHVVTDASIDHSKVNIEKKSEDINLDRMREAIEAKKKEDHKIALRELEKTIDELIVKLSKNSNNDNLETKEINKGIKDISKFAHLSDINVSDKNEEDGVDDFENFKDAFYKTFMDKRRPQVIYHGKDAKTTSHDTTQYHDESSNARKYKFAELSDKNDHAAEKFNDDFENFKDAFYKTFMDKEKKQNIIYHGKDPKKIISQGKEGSQAKKQYHDDSNNAKRSKWLTSEEIKKFADLHGISTSVKDEFHEGEKNVGGVESFKDFKDRFYKTFLSNDITFANKDKKENVAKQLVHHGKDARELIAPEHTDDFSDARLKDLVHLYDELKKQTVAEKEKKNIRLAKRTHNGEKRSMRIAALKKDLVALLDEESKTDSIHHQDVADHAEKNKQGSINRKRELSEDEETRVKGRLLSLVRSLEARLTGESEKDSSYKGKDLIENELERLASGSTKTKKKENNRFLEALQGFQRSKTSRENGLQ